MTDATTVDLLSVVIPTLNAAAGLGGTLASLTPLDAAEVIVVDGGSGDATAEIARRSGARVIAAPRGRGTQLAAGAAAAESPWRLFLHADTRLTADAAAAARRFMADPANRSRAAHFRFRLDDDSPAARRLERWVDRRCRWFALPYGDQGLLLHRSLYDAVGGFPAIPLMEDVDLVRRIGRRRLVALDAPVVTSADRYRRHGYGRRSARNLACLALHFLGVPPERIARLYG